MSSHGLPTSRVSATPSSAAEVSFSRLANQNAESSSRTDSRSSGKRSSRSFVQGDEETTTAVDDTPSSRGPHNSSPGHSSQRSGGFLLESSPSNGYPRGGGPGTRRGKRKAQEASLRVDKGRLAQTRLSGESSLGNSPLSREVSMDGAPGDTANEQEYRPSRPQSMDPAQLIQMALDLSESRKRHVSGPLQLPLSSPRAIRAASGFSTNYDAVRASSPRNGRQSILIDNNDRNSSQPDGPNRETDLKESAAESEENRADDVVYTFSAATLSRAEKAHNYFTLAGEHRRLLQYLPPLKPDASAPGNYTYISTSSPGSPLSDITRVPSYANNKHQLGRQYNPLQALRNRRIRTRERRPMTAPPETFSGTERTKDWVDQVEAATTDSQYRREQDKVRLPSFPGDVDSVIAVPDGPKGHRRSDTAGSVISKRENGWSIEPPELLADTYWTESGDNKVLIENRRGNRIFPALREAEKASRKSAEAVRDRDHKAASDQPNTVVVGHHNPRRHLLQKGHRKPPKISRSVSSSSGESVEKRTASALVSNNEGGEENIGPLSRHMQQMIAKEENGDPLSSDLVFPDHWDSKDTAFPAFKSNDNRHARKRLIGHLTVDTQFQHRRSRSADARVEAGVNALSSNEDLATPEPSSPVVAGLIPSMGIDLSPPPNRKSEKQKSKLHRLPLFRSTSKDRHNIEQTDFAAPAVQADSQPSEYRPKTSFDSLRPAPMQRNKTVDSYSNSLRRLNTGGTTASTTDGSTKDSGSSVGRFFRGGRIGELVRTEGSRLGDRFRGKDRTDDPTIFDTASTQDDRPERKAFLSPDADGDTSPYEVFDRGRSRLTFNLPSFTSPAARQGQVESQRPTSMDRDPISQQRDRFDAGQGPRSDRWILPRLNLPEGDPEFSTSRSGTFDEAHRKSYGFPDNITTSLSGPPSQRRSSQFAAQARRHWSISDKIQPQQASKVTMRDIARIRALLLSSGIKAREIQRRADTPREEPLSLATKAAATAKQYLKPVPVKEELLVVARMLSDTILSTVSEFQTALARFQDQTARSLRSQMEALQQKAAEQLTTQLHDTTDDADAFNVELTTKQPQDVKRVDDAIDAMLRRRRRQFRLIRRAGFKVLEWLVLGIMWWVWFIVVIINSARRLLVGFIAFLRWLIWF